MGMLRFERPAELVDAEQSSRVSQRMPQESAQSRHVAHVVPLDDVAEHCHVYVVVKKLMPRPRKRAPRLARGSGRGFRNESASCSLKARRERGRIVSATLELSFQKGEFYARISFSKG